MHSSQARRRGLERIRGLRSWQAGAILGGTALIAVSVGAVGLGAAGGGPAVQVLPSATGLKYSQTVQVKAQNLPKGSGSIAVTICGLNDAAGAKIATPGADDCAGAAELSSGLVKLQQWKDGTFDQQYTLPASGQKFGKNVRFCDAKHLCALVVADANPTAPAYHIDTPLQFVDQKPAGATTPTTKPKTKTTKPGTKPTPTKPPAKTPAAPAPAPIAEPPTTTTTEPPLLSISAGGSASGGSNGSKAGGSASINVTVTGPSGPTANPVPPQVADAVMKACTQLADAAKASGNDASSLTLACSSLVNGGGGAQLGMILQSPSLGCFAVAPLLQNNAQLADACSQLATALEPYSSQLGTGLAPVLALLP